MNNTQRLVYALIIAVGFLIISSLFSFQPGEFDWIFFVIAVGYSVISSVLCVFIVSAIVDSNPSVISSRLSICDSYETIEKERMWEKYKELYVKEHSVTNFYKAYNLYYYKGRNFASKRENPALNKAQFKRQFLDKSLKEQIKHESITLRKKNQIKKLVDDQDNVNYFDTERMKYKSNDFLVKPVSVYFKKIVAFLVQLVSLFLAVYSIYHFSVDLTKELSIKFSLLAVLFMGDVFTVWANVNNEIKYWKEKSINIATVIEILHGKRESDLKESIQFHVFASIKENDE